MKKYLNKEYLKELFIITFGNFLVAVSFSFFLDPNNLVIGGATGLATIFKNLFSNQDIMLEYDESCYFTYIKDVVINLEKITAEFHDEPIIGIVKNELYLKSDIIKLANTYLKSNSQLHLKNNMRPFPAYTPDCQKSLECKTKVYNGLINTIDNYKLLYLC